MQRGDLSFVFVIEGARLEVQSLLLADSLRRHHPLAEIVAYCPSGTDLPPEIADVLQACAVSLRPLELPKGLWRGAYPHGNKILALAQPRDSRWSMFLDTDMAVVAPINPEDLPGPMQISVVPEGIASWGKDLTRWEAAYQFFDLPMPEERIRLLRGRRRAFPPYFNAGMVALREEDRAGGLGFGALWRNTASAFDHGAKVGGKRPWLDQISLPLTMRRFGFAAKIVDERNNCSISNGRKLEGLAPAILHYHRAEFLRNWPGHEDLIAQMFERAPQHRAILTERLTQGSYLGALAPAAPPEAGAMAPQ
jgi:hypothetical protein